MNTINPAENVIQIQKLFQQMWNQQKAEVADQVFDPRVAIYFAYQKSVSLSEFKQLLISWYKAFPDLHHEIDDLISSEDKIVVRWHGIGTHLGNFNELPPSRKKFVYSGITIFAFNEQNKIIVAWVYSDFDSILTQLKTDSL